MFVRYPPAKIRYEGARPIALLKVRIAPSFRLVDLPLGTPTTSARSERGTWALYALGAEVVVVHPDGAVSGPPTDVAAEVGRLAAQERQGELDRQAAKTIQHLLTGDGADGAGPPRRSGARTWSIPAMAYWLSGPANDHGHADSCEQAGRFCISTVTTSSTPKPPASLQARRQGATASGPGINRGLGGPHLHAEVADAPSRPSGSRQPGARARHASTPRRRSTQKRRLIAEPAKEAKRDEDYRHLQQLPA
ncbi:MAG TPA: hypothetical protein VHM23_02810 [Actinomycetota bacterium]|nr:hypothetical protein [Actinomycetota bacterium]